MDLRPELEDWRGRALLPDVAALGIQGVESIRVSDLYFLAGDLDLAAAERVSAELLCDPVIAACSVIPAEETTGEPRVGDAWQVEVCLLPGVTDAEAESLLMAAARIGISGLSRAATATRYAISGAITEPQVRALVERLLCNPVIQRYALGSILPDLDPATRGAGDRVQSVPLAGLGDDELLALSRDRVLFLSLEEMHAIRDYFDAEGRAPTDVELETLAQTWSEHCGHKTFRAIIDYEEVTAEGRKSERIESLLQTYLASATRRIAKPWVRSAFIDNAGIVDFDQDNEVSFKVETHNHPSALEPFGGANTGVGGVVRDVIGVSARPIANTDVLCFGYQDRAFEDLPEGVLHPRRIFSGVVAGIEDYGNKMGIPTVNGAILFDDGYLANPLVYCGCVGIAPKGLHPRRVVPGDAVVMMGGRIGRDGLHGATFSSAELAHDTGETVGSVVQIGNPITEKKMLEAIMQARDRRLYHAITDCGAGGLSSAVGEMGEETGVSVELAHAPLKYPGLDPWEIWLSEAQERMVLAVPPENIPALEAICRQLDVEMTVIGHFTDDRRLRVHYRGKVVADLDMGFLHDGLPRRHLRGVWQQPIVRGDPPTAPSDLNGVLLQLLRCPNIASKEGAIRRYDHEVQAATVLKPLVGVLDGPSDATVLRPTYASDCWKGIALGCGINPRYSALDPYAMAVSVIDEAIRNVVCVGADPDQIALLDNFCWGNPNLPDRLGDLVRAAKGCYDGALAFGAPFISGKDSLNNEYTDGTTGRRISIPPTLLISSLGIVPDVRRAVTMDLKQPGNRLYLLGRTRNELGGSHYGLVLGQDWGGPPQAAPQGLELARALHRCLRMGLVRSCHDCAEGGLAVAAAEMCIAGNLGLELELKGIALDDDVKRTDLALFAESNSRYLVEVAPEASLAFEAQLADLPFALVGTVTARPFLTVTGLAGELALEASVADLLRAWSDQSYVNPAPIGP
ncbi:MAG: phosphoribosylformylglycinamidine synthase subunit PurL [Anaerolineae bacterium]|nr:phosphoribosylformylglycinamidine synthase subunit PurL [Anaerolineae bacterium]